MGRRENRRKPTRKEKIRDQRPEIRNQKKTERERRREVSPETRELVEAYAKVMGWTPERVLPHAAHEECR